MIFNFDGRRKKITDIRFHRQPFLKASTTCDQTFETMKIWILILVASLALSGCRDSRPDADVARRQFEAIYPEAQISEIKITEDEVVARVFLFRYKNKSSGQERQLSIQYLKTEEGDWVPQPAPPEILP